MGQNLWGLVVEHYPVVPCKFANGTYVSLLAGHRGLRHLPVGQNHMATHRVRMDEHLQLKAVVQKDLGLSST